MADSVLTQILALLVTDTDGNRLAVKYSTPGKKIWPTLKAQTAFEKKLVGKLPKQTGTARSETDVTIVDDFTVLHQSCNDTVICAVAPSSENELIVLQLIEGIAGAISTVVQQNFLSSGITKQQVLDNLAEVLFILDEVTDDAIIMETEEDKIAARVRMTDETDNPREAEQMFQKATQSAKQKLLGSLIGSRG
eukprot:NODE_20887_length_777_cov_11.384615.p1 GENE.NODE_20887_length_777_cov_11.384615~~NODE_20887_length_777_cov_11.384615.p1  ORF type:complete len:224 (+),score=77.71 NODE_20887_length_777_cov_11.384615:95-673(+)